MARVFITSTIGIGTSGSYEIKVDYPNSTDFAGVNLFEIVNNPRTGDVYVGVMHERFKTNSKYQTILDDIVGDNVLIVGKGLDMFADVLKDDVTVTRLDCVESSANIVTLTGSARYDNVYTADIFAWTPDEGIKYDTIVLDIYDLQSEYDDVTTGMTALETYVTPFLESGGIILKYVL